MALVIPKISETFEVVSALDSALDMTEKEFAAYRVAYDKSLLKFKPNEVPVIFVMRKGLSLDHQALVKSAQVKIKGNEQQYDFGSTLLEVRAHLADVLNGGEDIVFKRESDGMASKELMAGLGNAGIAQELWIALKTVVKPVEGNLRKK